MTNKEAIEKFKKIKRNIFSIHQRAKEKEVIEDYLLCDMAISALQAQDVPDANVGDTISRQAAIDALRDAENHAFNNFYKGLVKAHKIIADLPPAQPEIIRCKDCKYFELNHFEKVDGFPIPIIVAHEICMKWGEGCKSSADGWCFMAERRTDD